MLGASNRDRRSTNAYFRQKALTDDLDRAWNRRFGHCCRLARSKGETYSAPRRSVC